MRKLLFNLANSGVILCLFIILLKSGCDFFCSNFLLWPGATSGELGTVISGNFEKSTGDGLSVDGGVKSLVGVLIKPMAFAVGEL